MIRSTISGTILVVEDCEVLSELLDVLLSRMGYRVLTATSATEALQIARTFPEIHLFITNVDMPEMRGGKLARRFTRLHPSGRVIFLSSFNEPIHTPGPFDFLAKPFTIAELRDSVRRALQTRQTPAEAALVA